MTPARPRFAGLVTFTLALAGACTPATTRLAYHTLDSAAVGQPMDFAVHTPPG